MERERLRREAEKARRTQSVNTVEKDARSFLPPPRKVGKSSPSDKNLQKKLDKCFGTFEELSPFLVKDEIISRLVGVRRYPPTPSVVATSESQPALKLVVKKDCTAESNVSPSHAFSASPLPHGANSLIKKVKDILVTPLSGIDGTPVDRPAFTFPDTSRKSADVVANDGPIKTKSSTNKTKTISSTENDERLRPSTVTTAKRNEAQKNNDIDKQNDIKPPSVIDDDLRLSEDDDDDSEEEEELEEGEFKFDASKRCSDVEDNDNNKETGRLTENGAVALDVSTEDGHALQNDNKMTPTSVKAKLTSKSSHNGDQEIPSNKHALHSKSPDDGIDRTNNLVSQNSSMSMDGSTNNDSKPSSVNQRQWDLKFFLTSSDGANESTAPLPKNDGESVKSSSSFSPKHSTNSNNNNKHSKKSSAADKQSATKNNIIGEQHKKTNSVQIKSQENDASTSASASAAIKCEITSAADESDKKNVLKFSISKKNGVKLMNNQRTYYQNDQDGECKVDSSAESSTCSATVSASAEPLSSSIGGGDVNRKKKKLKLDKGHNSASIVPSTSSSAVAEQVSAASNGFVDTGSPDKENYSNYNGTCSTTTTNDHRGELINVRKKYSSTSSTKNAEAILQESRLSPLLSPIHEFPPFEYRNGIPSLICRLPLNLLSRIPPEPIFSSSKSAVKNGEKDNGFAASIGDYYDSKRKNVVETETADAAVVPVPSSRPRPRSSLSPPPHLYPCDVDVTSSSSNKSKHQKRISNGKIVNGGGGGSASNCDETSSSCNKDLDDVPIIERICSDKNVGSVKVNSSCVESSTNNNARLEKRDASSSSALVGTGVSSAASNNSKTSSTVEKTINDVAASYCSSKPSASREKDERKKTPSGSKRKSTSSEESSKINNETTPAKKPKLDNSSLLTFAPEKPVVFDCSVKDPKVYMEKAKEVKHRADGQGMDRTMRLVLYLESIIYFFLTGYSMEKTLNKESQRPFAMVKDTHELLKNVTQKYLSQLNELNETTQVLFAHKIEVLSLRVQALLCCQMFSIKQSSILSNYRHINEYQKNAKDRPSSVHGGLSTTTSSSLTTNENQTPSRSTNDEKAPASNGSSVSSSRPNAASTPSPTPSPASSTGSSSHSLPPGLVAIPQHVELLYKQQLNYLHNLLLAHHNWQLADTKLKQHDYAFFNHLDNICRPLTLTSTVPSVCIYVLTATHWLRQLHNHL